jgi:hypothetical protein
MPLDRPLPDDTREALKMLWSINEDQQVNIDRHRDSLHKVWHTAPVKPREGMLVFADGVDWDPGSGPGYYVFYAGAWHPMSGGGGGAAPVTSVFTRIGDVVAQTGDYSAAKVTNAVSDIGSYANPSWITSLAYAKLTGVPATFTPAAHTHAAADIVSGIMAPARLGSGTPSSTTYLRGDGAWTDLTWVTSSDARLKHNVRDLSGGLDVIQRVQPVEAVYNGLGGTPEGTRVVSFIAQELQKVLPDSVSSRRGKLRADDAEETDILQISLHEIIIHAVLAIKQLKEKVESLEAAALRSSDGI